MASSASVGCGAAAVVANVVEGSHVLKIQGYSKTKGLSSGECIRSGTFDVGGHGWRILYYPEGYEPGNTGWISFYLCLEESSAAEVEARIMFSLLDEEGEPVLSYRKGWSKIRTFKTIESENEWGFEKFIKRKTLEESPYMEDDCFRVRCDVVVLAYSKQFVTVPPPDMHRQIGRLLLSEASSQVEADVTFQVGTETVAAHRLVLAARSPVFMAELFGPMKESSTHHIRIDDMEARVFKAMLHFIYTDSLPDDVDKEEGALQMAEHLLVAADRYDIQRLKLMCEDKLCSYIDTSTVTTYLALAEQHGCTGLKEASFDFLNLSGNLTAIMQTDAFQHLTTICPSLLKELVLRLAP